MENFNVGDIVMPYDSDVFGDFEASPEDLS
jgi:hypothetical protein